MPTGNGVAGQTPVLDNLGVSQPKDRWEYGFSSVTSLHFRQNGSKIYYIKRDYRRERSNCETDLRNEHHNTCQRRIVLGIVLLHTVG